MGFCIQKLHKMYEICTSYKFGNSNCQGKLNNSIIKAYRLQGHSTYARLICPLSSYQFSRLELSGLLKNVLLPYGAHIISWSQEQINLRVNWISDPIHRMWSLCIAGNIIHLLNVLVFTLLENSRINSLSHSLVWSEIKFLSCLCWCVCLLLSCWLPLRLRPPSRLTGAALKLSKRRPVMFNKKRKWRQGKARANKDI